jgi:hypothetical protein
LGQLVGQLNAGLIGASRGKGRVGGGIRHDFGS